MSLQDPSNIIKARVNIIPKLPAAKEIFPVVVYLAPSLHTKLFKLPEDPKSPYVKMTPLISIAMEFKKIRKQDIINIIFFLV